MASRSMRLMMRDAHPADLGSMILPRIYLKVSVLTIKILSIFSSVVRGGGGKVTRHCVASQRWRSVLQNLCTITTYYDLQVILLSFQEDLTLGVQFTGEEIKPDFSP